MTSLRRLRSSCAALAALAWVCAAPALAAPVTRPFVRLAGPAPEASAEPAPGGLRVRVDADALVRLGAAREARIVIPIDDASEVEATLERFEVLAPGARVLATSDEGPRPIAAGVALFRGSIAGVADSWVVLGVTSDEVLGVVRIGDRLSGVGPVRRRGAPGVHAAPEFHAIAEVGAAPRSFECLADDLAEQAGVAPRAPRRGGLALEATTTRLRCDVAIDCDYEFYLNKFNGDLAAATSYVLTVMGVASAIYERDVNTSLLVSYLNVWTTASDPYTSGSTSPQLSQFRSWWNSNRSGVSRDLAHLFSGRSLGGGIAYLGVLCNLSSGYAVSALDAGYEYPSNTATWDANVVAHETGHNFGSPHTHSCFWQSAGYVPPGALLDSCYTPEGSCYSGTTGFLPTNGGTIMSYCHLISGVANGIRMDFHPACALEMREQAEDCLGATALQPPGGLSAAVSSWTASLSWTASPSSGVTGYELCASGFAADWAPPLLASTAGLSFADDNVIGTRHYKVRALTNSGPTPYTGAVGVTIPCTPAGPTILPVGGTPGPVETADFNEDGILDLAVGNLTAAGTISVLLGNGAGGAGNGLFGPRVSYASGTRPVAMAIADVNQDGVLDLVAVNDATSGGYSILLGNGAGGVGDGTFAAPLSSPAGQSPKALVVADFDEDGILDLAIANGGGHSVTTHRGLGANGADQGAFEAPVVHPVGLQPTALVAGDFDEDGITDLAVTCKSAGTVEVLRGNGAGGVGDGTFAAPQAHAAGLNATGLVAGDFDEDGITDLATLVAGMSESNVAVLRGTGAGGVGDGGFAAAQTHPCGTAATVLAMADVNGNGIADLLVGSTAEGGVLNVLLGTGAAGVSDGGFAEPYPAPVGVGVQGLVLGDFEEDGFLDWAVVGGSSTARLFYGSCAPSRPATLAVVAPNGGEAWMLGTEQTITWAKGDAIAAVTIELSRDGGTTWEPVASDVTGTSLSWTVTAPATGVTARVRVSDSASPTRADQSDAPFEIPGGALDVPEFAPVALRLAGVAPRARGVAVAFELPGEGAASLALVDVAGRRVASLEVGSLGAGRHEALLVPARAARSGVYWVTLTRAGERVSRKVALLK